MNWNEKKSESDKMHFMVYNAVSFSIREKFICKLVRGRKMCLALISFRKSLHLRFHCNLCIEHNSVWFFIILGIFSLVISNDDDNDIDINDDRMMCVQQMSTQQIATYDRNIWIICTHTLRWQRKFNKLTGFWCANIFRVHCISMDLCSRVRK